MSKKKRDGIFVNMGWVRLTGRNKPLTTSLQVKSYKPQNTKPLVFFLHFIIIFFFG